MSFPAADCLINRCRGRFFASSRPDETVFLPSTSNRDDLRTRTRAPGQETKTAETRVQTERRGTETVPVHAVSCPHVRTEKSNSQRRRGGGVYSSAAWSSSVFICGIISALRRARLAQPLPFREKREILQSLIHHALVGIIQEKIKLLSTPGRGWITASAERIEAEKNALLYRIIYLLILFHSFSI